MVHAGATVIVVMMVGHIGPLGDDDCRHSQSGRMIVLVPLADPFHGNHNKHTDYQNEYQCEHNAKQIKAAEATKRGIKTESHTHFSLSLLPGGADAAPPFSNTSIPSCLAIPGLFLTFSISRMVRIRCRVPICIPSFLQYNTLWFLILYCREGMQ